MPPSFVSHHLLKRERLVELVGSTVPNYEINDYLGFGINLAF